MPRIKAPDRLAIKMSREIVEKARTLSELVARRGWEALGIDRSDPATITAVTEAAIDLLTECAKRKR